MLTKPGVLLYAFLQRPFYDDGAMTIEHANSMTRQVAKVWESQFHPDLEFGADWSIDPAVASLTAAGNLETLQGELTALLKDSAEDQLIACATTVPSAAAPLHKIALHTAHDVLILTRLICENRTEADSIPKLAVEAEAVLEHFQTLEQLIGVACTFFCESDAAATDCPIFAEAVAESLGHQPNPQFEPTVIADHFHASRPFPIQRLAQDEPLWADYWALTYARGRLADDDFHWTFIVSRGRDQLPAAVQYLLTMTKVRYYEGLVLIARGALRKRILRFAKTLKRIARRPTLDAETLRKLQEQFVKISDQGQLLQRFLTTIKLASWTYRECASNISSPVAPPRHGILGEDRYACRRAVLQATSELEYAASHRQQIQIQVELLSVQQERAQAEAHERLEAAFHLLEVFVIAVYAVELLDLFHKSHWGALVLALLSAVLVVLFIRSEEGRRAEREVAGPPPKGQAGAKRTEGPGHDPWAQWRVRLLWVAVLVLIPFLCSRWLPRESDDEAKASRPATGETTSTPRQEPREVR